MEEGEAGEVSGTKSLKRVLQSAETMGKEVER
jgi:hypothetical protein